MSFLEYVKKGYNKIVNRSKTIIEDKKSDELYKQNDPRFLEYIITETKKAVFDSLKEANAPLEEIVEPMGFLIDRLCIENNKVYVFETKIRELGMVSLPDDETMKQIVMYVNLSRQANDNRVAYKNAITKKFKEIKEGTDKGLIETRTWNG